MDKAFSPYFAIKRFDGKSDIGGINWSYAAFPTKEKAEAFAKACNDNGYRTRNLHRVADTADTWSVQYHHIED
jgi:hypothetical protein